jgi:hypothetical protein
LALADPFQRNVKFRYAMAKKVFGTATSATALAVTSIIQEACSRYSKKANALYVAQPM